MARRLFPAGISRARCACGCRRPTAINRKTGKPNRFVNGHQHRVYRAAGWNAHEPRWFDRRRRA